MDSENMSSEKNGDKMKILVLTSALRPKTDEIFDFLYEIFGRMVKKGHEIVIVAPHAKGSPKQETFKGIKIVRFQYFWPASLQRLAYGGGFAQNIGSSLAKAQLLPYMASALLAARREIKKFRPDIVQALWTFPPGCIAKLLKKPLGFKLALHIFGAEPFLAKTYKVAGCVTWPAKSADLLTVNSKSALEAAVSLGLGRQKAKVFFWGGIDTERFNPKNSGKAIRKRLGIGDSKLILIVGRAVERKGHRYLVEAMPLVLKKFRDAKLVIVGTGPELGKIKPMVEKAGLQGSVIFAGRVAAKELPLYYAACDVFCLPAIIDSRGETEGGQGIAMLEAMASGKPVVASNVGGIPDAVKHGWNGLLIEEKNSKKLADALCKVLSDKKLADRLSKTGAEFIQRERSYDTFVESLAKQYEKTGRQD